MAYSTALLFTLGKVPGWPRVMTLTLVLGMLPNAAESEAYIMLLVNSCACTSNHITTVYLSLIALVIFLDLFFVADHKCRCEKYNPHFNVPAVFSLEND